MNYGYQPYPQGYAQGYGQPMQDQLAQLRQPYQPMQMQSQPIPQGQPMMQAAQPPDNGMIWVQGEAGAKAYMVAPGNSVVLWDSEDHVIYIKSADMAGMPGMRVFEYVERTAAPRNVPDGNANPYVTREEFNALAARLEQIQMMQPVTGGTEVNNNAE